LLYIPLCSEPDLPQLSMLRSSPSGIHSPV